MVDDTVAVPLLEPHLLPGASNAASEMSVASVAPYLQKITC